MPGKLSLAAARRREGRLAAGFPRSVMADRLEPGEQSARHGGAVDAPHVMLAAWLPPTHARLVHVVIPESSIKARSRNSTIGAADSATLLKATLPSQIPVCTYYLQTSMLMAIEA